MVRGPWPHGVLLSPEMQAELGDTPAALDQDPLGTRWLATAVSGYLAS